VPALAAVPAGSVGLSPSGCPARAGYRRTWGSSPCVPDWAACTPAAVLGKCPATSYSELAWLLDIELIYPGCALIDLHPLPRQLQVPRWAVGFATNGIAPGFILRCAHPPCSAAPSIWFLFIGSRFTLHASSPRSVALTRLRFALLTVTRSQRDLRPQVYAHAGRTKNKTHRVNGGFCKSLQI
jgi:hypothetical protein